MNYLILFPQDAKNLNHIHADHCDGDMSLNEFKSFCRQVWESAPHNFICIDLTSGKLNGKYRKNLSHYWIPKYDMLMEELKEDRTS